MSFASDLLADLDDIRAIPDELGLRPFVVSVMVRVWSGARTGVGTKTDTITTLNVGAGKARPKFKQLSQNDVVASGGLYSTGDWRMGPVTPQYIGGGVTIGTIDPPTSASPTEVLFKVTGQGFPSAGQWFERVGDLVDSALRYHVVLRETARIP